MERKYANKKAVVFEEPVGQLVRFTGLFNAMYGGDLVGPVIELDNAPLVMPARFSPGSLTFWGDILHGYDIDKIWAQLFSDMPDEKGQGHEIGKREKVNLKPAFPFVRHSKGVE